MAKSLEGSSALSLSSLAMEEFFSHATTQELMKGILSDSDDESRALEQILKNPQLLLQLYADCMQVRIEDVPFEKIESIRLFFHERIATLCLKNQETKQYEIQHLQFFQEHALMFMANGFVPVLCGERDNAWGAPLYPLYGRIGGETNGTAFPAEHIKLLKLPEGITMADFVEPADREEVMQKAQKGTLGFSEENIAPYMSVLTMSAHRQEGQIDHVECSSPITVPIGNIASHPLEQVRQYGTGLFEGMAAERGPDGDIYIFGLQNHWKRMNKGAVFLGMPKVPMEAFKKMVIDTIRANVDSIPPAGQGRLYLRPNLWDHGEKIHVDTSDKCFALLISAVTIGSLESYFAKGEKIFFMPTNFHRAVDRGLGQTKAIGNYSGTIQLLQKLEQHRMHGVVFLDPKQKRIEETNASGVIFIQKTKDGDYRIITPSLKHQTILDSITRKTILALAKDKGWEVEEKDIHPDEIYALTQEDAEEPIVEMYAIGTGAGMAPVNKLQMGTFTIDDETGEGYLKKEGKPLVVSEYDLQNPWGEAGKIILEKLLKAKNGVLATEHPEKEYLQWVTRISLDSTD